MVSTLTNTALLAVVCVGVGVWLLWASTTSDISSSSSSSNSSSSSSSWWHFSSLPFSSTTHVVRQQKQQQSNSQSQSQHRDEGAYGAAPFCRADGTCHETPWIASPRTVYSAWTREQYDAWWRCHATLNITARMCARQHARQRHEEQQLQQSSSSSSSSLSSTSSSLPPRSLILIGDSITESWLGTGMGIPKARTEGVPAVLDEWMQFSTIISSNNNHNRNNSPLILAISGDQTQHVLYRLQHGELLDDVYPATDPNAIYVLLIGTNNLGSGELPGPTAQGIIAIARYILERTRGFVLVLDILPRGDGRTLLPNLCPPRCTNDGRPFTSFLPAIARVNSMVRIEIESIVATQKQRQQKRRIDNLDCGTPFLLVKQQNDNDNAPQPLRQEGGEEVNITLMPDRLHPNAEGHRLLANCIETYAKEHLSLMSFS